MKIKVADRLQQVEEYYFSKKLDQIQKMRQQGIEVINLGIGSPDLIPPPEALRAASETIQQTNAHGYASYRSTPELRTAIAEWYQKTYRVTLNPAREILPLLGSKEGVLYLSLALLNPGDTVLVPNPGYPAYASVANLIGAKVIYYDLTEQNGWLPDLKKLSAQDLSHCKLMWTNYPHMPTGQVCPPEFFAQLIAFAKAKQIFVCNDNPYGLILNTTTPQSLLAADATKEISGELNSLSKSFNMAGWRVGMFSSSSEMIEAVLRVKSNVDSGMFLAVQKGAIAALGASDAWHESRNAIYFRRRELIRKIFDRLKFTYTQDQVGLFVWAKAPDSVKNVANYLEEVLEQAHVFLTPGMIFGSNGDRFARASLCAPEEILEKALARIEEFTS
jgi:LL-diaminopimelate aminotransferase